MKKSLSIYAFLLSLKIVFIVNKFAAGLLPKDYDVILCFHDVGSSGWEYSVTKNQFAKQMKALVNVAKIVGLDEIFKKSKGGVRVAITFDDGYKNVYKNAYPVLKNQKANAAVFIVGSRDIEINTNYKAELLNFPETKTLRKSGWEIGFHTVSHPDVSKLAEVDLQKEIGSGKKSLEKKLGFKMKYFAYPFGRFNDASKKVVKDAGFTAAFTVDGTSVTLEDSYLISRVTVSKYISERDLVAMISPLGIVVNSIFTKLWKIKDTWLG